jgi:hypothetical protein
VFTLSQNQADYLGHPDARFIGLYYIREGNGTTSMLASHSTSRR